MKKASIYRLGFAILVLLSAMWLVWRWLDDDVGGASAASGQPRSIETNSRGNKAFTEDQKEAILAEINVPIIFYGSVVDQDAVPLGGVDILYRITSEGILPAVGGKSERVRNHAVTNGNGRFSIDGVRGTTLNILKVEKDGYIPITSEGISFAYSGSASVHRPDPGHPVQFTIPKTGLGYEIVEWKTRLDFKWDGAGRRYDLTTGKPSGTGGLEIIPRRKRFVEQQPRDFDWCFDINVRGGGIVQIDERVGPVAPKEGYEESLSLGVGYSDREKLLAETSVHLCVKSAQGSYGLLKLVVYPDSRETDRFAGMLYGTWNPTGSPVLGREKRPGAQ